MYIFTLIAIFFQQCKDPNHPNTLDCLTRPPPPRVARTSATTLKTGKRLSFSLFWSHTTDWCHWRRRRAGPECSKRVTIRSQNFAPSEVASLLVSQVYAFLNTLFSVFLFYSPDCRPESRVPSTNRLQGQSLCWWNSTWSARTDGDRSRWLRVF